MKNKERKNGSGQAHIGGLKLRLASKFETYKPQNFEQQERRILYVGKATRGDCKNMIPQNVHESMQSAFWHFARRISALADPNVDRHCNLAWSNIFKQGVTFGNPLRKDAEAQQQEASEALRADVHRLEPTIIVLVTAGYYEEIPKAAYDIGTDGLSGMVRTTVGIDGKEYKYDLWSRPDHGPFPPIVWMAHPQGKRRAYLDEALELIMQTAGW